MANPRNTERQAEQLRRSATSYGQHTISGMIRIEKMHIAVIDHGSCCLANRVLANFDERNRNRFCRHFDQLMDRHSKQTSTG